MLKLVILFCFTLVSSFVSADEVIEDECPSGNGITSICGFLPPEDIDVVPGGKAIIVGGFSLDNENGDVRVLHLADNSIETIYSPDMMGPAPSSSDVEIWGDPDCPGPPTGFAAHGIQLSENKHGSYTLMVVNHTSRESVEFLEANEGVFVHGILVIKFVMKSVTLWIRAENCMKTIKIRRKQLKRT